MRFSIAAVFALAAASPLGAQATTDLSTATPIAGSWSYAPVADGSDAVFANSAGAPQLFVHCARATRHVMISKPATAAAPAINVWTSSLSRSVAATFNPVTARLTIDLANYDPLLDAIASSHGRIGFSAGSQSPLVVVPWAEVARVIEDCRA